MNQESLVFHPEDDFDQQYLGLFFFRYTAFEHLCKEYSSFDQPYM